MTIELKSAVPGQNIYYSLDGKDPVKFGTLYTKPFLIDKSTHLKALSEQREFTALQLMLTFSKFKQEEAYQ